MQGGSPRTVVVRNGTADAPITVCGTHTPPAPDRLMASEHRPYKRRGNREARCHPESYQRHCCAATPLRRLAAVLARATERTSDARACASTPAPPVSAPSATLNYAYASNDFTVTGARESALQLAFTP